MLCCQINPEVICSFCRHKWCRTCWHNETKHHRAKGVFTTCPSTGKENLRWEEVYSEFHKGLRAITSHDL